MGTSFTLRFSQLFTGKTFVLTGEITDPSFAGSWKQSRVVSSIRARLKVQLKLVPMLSSCFRLVCLFTLSCGLLEDALNRCWMTLQNPSLCQARLVPAHCATSVLVFRGMSRTGVCILLDFPWTFFYPGGPKRDL